MSTIGVFLLRPGADDPFRSYREWQLRLMPWLRRIPGFDFVYSDRVQRILRFTVGCLFVAMGLLILVGAVETG